MWIFSSFRHTCKFLIAHCVCDVMWYDCQLCLASLQLRVGRQRLPHYADRVQQSLHPHLWWEWSREDGGLQEDSAVLCCELPQHHSAEHCQGQNAHVQPRPRGPMGVYCGMTRVTCETAAHPRVCGVLVCSCRLLGMPKHWKMITPVGLGSIWIFSLTARWAWRGTFTVGPNPSSPAAC